MRNLIDKDDTLKIIADTISLYGTGTKVESEILNIVSKIPSAEPKKGQWEEKSVFEDSIQEWQSARCSVCNKYHTTPYLYYFDNFKYCPNCGASMGMTK